MQREKHTPIYQHIVNDIQDKILREELKPNDSIPTQIELAKLYNTSEMTSRRALSELVKEGLVYRVRGKGSFVADISRPEASSEKQLKKIFFVHPKTNLHVFNHRFYSDLLNGIQQTCEENGIEFYTWQIGQSMELPQDSDSGVILITNLPGSDEIQLETLYKWKESGRHIVTVHFYYPHLSIPYVIIDNLTGGYLATQHLLSLGHKRIGIILTGKSQIDHLNQEFSLRFQGYRLALAQHRVDFDPELVCVVEGTQELEEMGYEGLKQLYSLKNPPTAIFATSDYKAIGAIHAAHHLGLSVPDDISIVGYDDVIASRYMMPNVTTVNQNSTQLGRRAVEILLLECDDAKAPPKDEIVPQLIIRNSTAKCSK